MILFIVLGACLLLALGLIFYPSIKHKVKRTAQAKDTRLPHERYPRILNWRKGDEMQTREGKHWPRFFAGRAKLLGLTTDGSVFLEDYERKWHLSLDDVCENCWNLDASNREISEEMKASKGYTQALAEFNHSVQELQRRDEMNGVDLPDKYYPEVPTHLYM